MPQGPSTYEQRAAARRERLAAIRANKKPSLWETLNTPLTDVVSRNARKVSDYITTPELDDSRFTAMAKGFAGGAVEGVGNILEGFTSPLGIVTTAATLGTGTAAKAGLTGTSRALGMFNRGVGGAVAGHGAYNMAGGVNDMIEDGVDMESAGRLGMGALEVAGGTLGMRSPMPPRATPKPATPPARPAARPRSGQIPAILGPVEDVAPKPNFTPDTVPAYQEGRYGVNRRNWAEGNPMLSHVPERLRPASPTESFFESMLPSRTKELASLPDEAFTQMGRPQGGPRLGPVADIGAPPSGQVAPTGGVLPAGTISRLRKIGLPEEEIGKLDIERANSFLELYDKRPKVPKARKGEKVGTVKKPPVTKEGEKSLMPEASERAGFDPNRPLKRATDADIQALAKRGIQSAIDELAIRAKNNMGFYIGEDGVAVDPPKPRLGIADRLRDETGAAGPGTEKLMRSRIAKNDDGSVNVAGVAMEADELPHMKSYRDWVNSRKASKVEGILKARDFRDLDAKGMDGIHEFQSGLRDGRYADVQTYFDDMHKMLDEAGVRQGFKENYLPQLWDNSKDEVFQIQRRLGLKPKFTLRSVLENYEVGEALGLKPKFQNISELVGWYEQTARKALADRQFFDYLKTNDLIRRGDQAPSHWISLDPDHFPISKMKTKKKEFQGVLKAPPEVAKLVNNYLRDPAEIGGSVMSALGDAASLSKNAVLSSGMVPGTALNAHGFNIAVRNTVARGLKGGVEAAKYLVNTGADNPIAKGIEKIAPWKSARADLDDALHTAPRAVKYGLTLTTEDHLIDKVGSTHLGESVGRYLDKKLGDSKLKGAKDTASKGINFVLEKHGKFFEDPLFRNVVPALKLKHFNAMFDDLVKQGLPEEQAGAQAAQMTNTLYGGINWEAMGRSRDLQNALRAFILAPDWLESNARIAKGMGKTMLSPNTPEGRKYAIMARNLVGAYIGANVLNAALNDGQLMIQNEPGKKLQIKIGKSGTKDRYLNPFGTGVDFFRLPLEAIASGIQGDLGQSARILKNRTSTTVRPAINLLWNQNDFGRPITGRDAYGRDIPVGKQALDMLGEVSEIATPSYIANPMGLATGKHENAEQALLGAVEAPVRYSRPSQKGKRRRRSRSRQR